MPASHGLRPFYRYGALALFIARLMPRRILMDIQSSLERFLELLCNMYRQRRVDGANCHLFAIALDVQYAGAMVARLLYRFFVLYHPHNLGRPSGEHLAFEMNRSQRYIITNPLARGTKRLLEFAEFFLRDLV